MQARVPEVDALQVLVVPGRPGLSQAGEKDVANDREDGLVASSTARSHHAMRGRRGHAARTALRTPWRLRTTRRAARRRSGRALARGRSTRSHLCTACSTTRALIT